MSIVHRIRIFLSCFVYSLFSYSLVQRQRERVVLVNSHSYINCAIIHLMTSFCMRKSLLSFVFSICSIQVNPRTYKQEIISYSLR